MKFFLIIIGIALIVLIGLFIRRGGSFFKKSDSSEAVVDTIVVKPLPVTAEQFRKYLNGRWDFVLSDVFPTNSHLYKGKIDLKEDGTFTKSISLEVSLEYSTGVKLVYSGKISGTWKATGPHSWKETITSCTVKQTYKERYFDDTTLIVRNPCKLCDKQYFGNSDQEAMTTRIKELSDSTMLIEGKIYDPAGNIGYTFNRVTMRL